MPKHKRVTGVSPFWVNENRTITFYSGDCLKVMGELFPSSIDLVFADPPFNIGKEYDQYRDYKAKAEYLNWCGEWLALCRELLRPGGSIYVAIGIHLQAEMKLLMDKGGFHWRNTIAWHYTFGPNQETNFTPSWVAIHYYTKSPNTWTWNGNDVRVPSARQLKYGDRRANKSGKIPDNTWVLLPNDREDVFRDGDNAWLHSRVCGTFGERTGHPCQMAEAILERIIRASSSPGDVVLDPFLGSGTTAKAASSLGRKCIGIELSESYLRDYCVPRMIGDKK